MISAKDRVSLLTIVWAQRELTRQVSLAVATGADLSFGLEILTLHVTMLHGGVLGPKELTKLLYHGSWLYKETKKQITHHHDHKKLDIECDLQTRQDKLYQHHKIFSSKICTARFLASLNLDLLLQL
jgi:hypothetical protein